MAIVAVHCAKTITVAASGNDLLRTCVRLLLPGLIHFVARISPRLDDGPLSEQNNASIEEVWRAFSALIALTTTEQRKRFPIIVLFPTSHCEYRDSCSEHHLAYSHALAPSFPKSAFQYTLKCSYTVTLVCNLVPGQLQRSNYTT